MCGFLIYIIYLIYLQKTVANTNIVQLDVSNLDTLEALHSLPPKIAERTFYTLKNPNTANILKCNLILLIWTHGCLYYLR
jgi:hypothetical protein